MKFTKYIMLLAAAAGLSAACQKLEMVQIDPANAVAPVLEQIDPLVITEDNLDENVVFSWSEADYSAPVEIAYSISVAYNDQKVELVSVKDTTKASVAYAKINDRLLYGLNAPADQEVEAEFYVSSRVGESQWLASAPVVVKVTTMNAEQEKVYSEWGLVGTVNSWGGSDENKIPDLKLEESGDYFVYKGLDLKDNDEVKFRKNNAWGGDVTADPSVCKPNVTILLAGGQGNMKFAAGTYDVYINADCSKCWFMTEGKTPDDAGAPVEPEPEPETHSWSVVGIPDFNTDIDMVEKEGIWTAYSVELKANTGFKIRADEDWKLSYGAENPEGLEAAIVIALDQATKVTSTNGANMAVAADGKYDISFDLANETVTIKAASTEPVVSAWGIVGTINEWGKTPDKELIKDGEYFVHKGLVLTAADEIKFRKDNKWPQEGGDDASAVTVVAPDTELTLAAGKDNMKFPAGTYDVYTDANCTKAWFMTDGKTPADAAAPIEQKEVWSLLGTLTEWETHELDLTNVDGIWKAEGIVFPEGATFLIRFKHDWNEKYGVAAQGDVVKVGEETTLKKGGNDIKLDNAGTFDIVFNPEGGKLLITPTPIN